MKVIWFTNIVLPEFAREIGLVTINQGGWIPSLVDAIRKYAPQIELHICSAGPEGRQATIGGVRYYALGSEYNGIFLHRPSRCFVENATSIVKKIEPDLIHFHGSEGLFGIVPHNAYSRTKCVVSLQGILQGYYPHYTGGINEIEIRRYRNYANYVLTRYTVTRGSESWRCRLGERERLALASAENIIGRTRWDRAWAEYLAPDARYFHVGEVLRPEFYCGKYARDGVRPHSIFCGGAMAYPLKGGHWLLRAVAAIKRRYPDVRLRVANAGKVMPKGTFSSWLRRNEYHRYLWRIITKNELEENVVLLPSLTAEQVAEELRAAEVFCLPSMCENSPNSVGEAMMAGTPVVATDVGGVSSIVENGEEGVLVPSGDPAILANAISDLFASPQKARSYANNAYVKAKARYAHRHVVDQLLDAYGAIVDGAGR